MRCRFPIESDGVRALLLAAAMSLRTEGPCLLHRNTFGRLTVVGLRAPMFIGSSHEAAFRVNDPTVSRFHCVVYPPSQPKTKPTSKTSWWIRDLCSRNGTYLNGHRVTHPTRLQDGDLIRFGRTQSALVILAPDTLPTDASSLLRSHR